MSVAALRQCDILRKPRGRIRVSRCGLCEFPSQIQRLEGGDTPRQRLFTSSFDSGFLPAGSDR